MVVDFTGTPLFGWVYLLMYCRFNGWNSGEFQYDIRRSLAIQITVGGSAEDRTLRRACVTRLYEQGGPVDRIGEHVRRWRSWIIPRLENGA